MPRAPKPGSRRAASASAAVSRGGDPVARLAASRWLPVAFVALAAVATHLPSLAFDMTGVDDELLIISDRAFLEDFSNVGRAFARDVFDVPQYPHEAQFYRPLFTLSLMVDMRRGGVDPAPGEMAVSEPGHRGRGGGLNGDRGRLLQDHFVPDAGYVRFHDPTDRQCAAAHVKGPT